MTVCWFFTPSNDGEGLEAAETEAEECMEKGENETEIVNPGTYLSPGKKYMLVFNQKSFASSGYVKPSSAEASVSTAWFFQHFPSEFEDKVHWLQDASGGDIEAGVEEPSGETAPPNEKGKAYLATFIVIAVCFSGVIFVNKYVVEYFGGSNRFKNYANAFASGDLLYDAFALLIPESIHLIGEEVNGSRYTESEASAIIASTIVIGVLFCIAFEIIFGHSHAAKASAGTTAGDIAGSKVKDIEMDELAITNGATNGTNGHAVDEKPNPKHLFDFSAVNPICWNIVVGDFFHNFTDGIVIGAAFMVCDTSAGWTVTAGTIYHEIAQEVADFMVLTTEGRMSFAQAALFNFLSSLGILVGTLITTESNLNSPFQGALMVFGASFYVYIALADLQWWKLREDLTRNLCIFLFGCVSIGLVLIAHEHCSPAGSDGHDHHHH